jgi:anti-anti-sigma regulatory factor
MASSPRTTALPRTPPASRVDDEIRIDGPLTIPFVESWRTRLSAALDRSSAPTINLAAAAEFDAFGLQLLWSARCTAKAQGKSFRLSGAGEAFAGACQSAGFDPVCFDRNPTEPS